jgi:branched-chain amino acid transport system substrate-binding protein
MHKQMQGVNACRCGRPVEMPESAFRFPVVALKIRWLRTIRTILLLAGSALASIASGADSIRIGDLNSYSAAPLFTEPYRKGWQLGVEEINAAGGVDGRMLTVISRDDGALQSTAIRQARALLSQDKVDVLAGTHLSNIG